MAHAVVPSLGLWEPSVNMLAVLIPSLLLLFYRFLKSSLAYRSLEADCFFESGKKLTGTLGISHGGWFSSSGRRMVSKSRTLWAVRWNLITTTLGVLRVFQMVGELYVSFADSKKGLLILSPNLIR